MRVVHAHPRHQTIQVTAEILSVETARQAKTSDQVAMEYRSLEICQAASEQTPFDAGCPQSGHVGELEVHILVLSA